MTGSSKTSSAIAAIRLIKLMQLIPTNREGVRRRIGTRELEVKLKEMGFKVSRRTLQRDLQNLQGAFPGLLNDEQRDALGWFWEDSMTTTESIPAMDYTMAFAITLLDRLLYPQLPGLMNRMQPLVRAAHRLLDAQKNKTPERIYVIPRTMPLKPVEQDDAINDGIYEALVTGRRFRAQYRRRDGAVAEYQLNPLGLVFRHEITYLVATAWDYDDPRHYALHRFVPGTLALQDEKAREPEGFSLAEYIHKGGFQYLRSQAVVKLRLLMEAETAQHLEETPLSDDQVISDARKERAGWKVIRASVPDTEQLRWWLLGLGGKVMVKAPKKLAREIQSLHAEALALYEPL